MQCIQFVRYIFHVVLARKVRCCINEVCNLSYGMLADSGVVLTLGNAMRHILFVSKSILATTITLLGLRGEMVFLNSLAMHNVD